MTVETPTAARRRGPFTRMSLALSDTHRLNPGGWAGALIATLSVIAVLLICYLALVAHVTSHLQVSLFLVLLAPICFLTTTIHPDVRGTTAVDVAFAIATTAAAGWFALNEPRYAEWMAGFSTLERGDFIAGTVLVVAVVELCRRTVGVGLTAVVLALLLYVAFGHLMTGSFRHPPVSYEYFLEMQTVTTDGIFGSPLYVAASYAFLFVLFGNFYVISGGGQLFFDLGAALTGRMVGGPAKACIFSSGLYGSISGSPVADVATTGPVSIPIMKRIGISPEQAGAIEAAASTGGSMLPPVMGAVAFIMADFTGIPYFQICLFAALPALGYYFGVFTFVHFDSVRRDLARLPEEEIVGLRRAVTDNWPSFLPIFALIWLLVNGYSAAYVAAGSVLAVILSSWLRRSGAIGPRRFVQACVETCHSAVPLAAAVAAAGLVIGCIELTGLSGKFTLLLFELSGGLLAPSLLLSGVILILLGMGMPTTGVYIMGVALLAPVLSGKFGLPTMPVHMFLLFYACLSAITPPVAVASFAAASIAGANPFKLGPYACKLAVGGFVLPFFFLFNRGILFQGAWGDIVRDTVLGFTLVFVAVLALQGSVRREATPVVARLFFAVCCVGMIIPNLPLQIAAAVGALGLYALLYRGARGREGVAAGAA